MQLGAALSLLAEARMLQTAAGRGIFETVGDALGGNKDEFNAVDIMRGKMCATRGDRIEHTDCMEWKVKKCKKKTASSGHGICTNLRAHVKEECFEKKNEKACEYARQLGIEGEEKEEEPQKVAQKVEEDKPLIVPVQDEHPAPAPAPPRAPPAPSARPPLKPPPAPAPAKEAAKVEDDGDKPLIPKGDAIPGGYQEPKPGEKLQSQGFRGKKVRHESGETATADWGKEYGNESGQRVRNSGGHSSGSVWPYLIASMALLIARLS